MNAIPHVQAYTTGPHRVIYVDIAPRMDIVACGLWIACFHRPDPGLRNRQKERRKDHRKREKEQAIRERERDESERKRETEKQRERDTEREIEREK